MGQLDVVVQKADRPAAERDEEHGQGRNGVRAESEEGDAGGHQDQQAAQHRRALLEHVVLRPLLADVLAELIAPQELDELRAEQDRDEQGEDACDQHTGQALTAASASATRSRPTEREALTRTQSPGRTIPSTTAIAASAPISSWKPGPPGPSSAISPRTATRRRSPANATRCASAARIESGLAL